MNQHHEEENSQFRLQAEKLNDDIDDEGIPTEVNELKLEKISQRVTLISILIPVLIVIVLVIAYLDIKKRVVQTEDTGEIEFQKLSSDLESRFSSLSVRQARLEDAMAKFTEQNNHGTAAIQVRLEKLNDAIGLVRKNAIDAKDLDATKAEMVKQINGVIDSANQAGDQIAAITEKLKTQMDQLNRALNAADLKIDAIDRKLADIDQAKIDKPELDLALKLEALKIETALKSQVQALQSKIGALEDLLKRRSSRSSPATGGAVSASDVKPVRPNSSATPPPPSKKEISPKPQIEEQTIGK